MCHVQYLQNVLEHFQMEYLHLWENFQKCSRALHSCCTILRKICLSFKKLHIYILLKLSFGLSIWILKLAQTVYYITTIFEAGYLRSLNNAFKKIGGHYSCGTEISMMFSPVLLTNLGPLQYPHSHVIVISNASFP